MYRKLIYLLSFVLVLGLVSNVSAELVAHWTFDEGSGNIAYDSSGNGNNGTINGAEWGAGKYGPALNFNAQDNYVEVPTSDSLEIDTNVTIAAWINWIDAGDTWICIMANGQQDGPWENYGLFVNRGGRFLYFTLSLDGGHVTQQTPNDVIEPDEWLHACATWDGSNARIYVNGEMVLEQAQTGQLVPPQLPLRIGHRNGSAHYYNGIIDDVRIYNHTLTEVEILAAMEGSEGYPYALGPVPEDGALLEDTWVNLSWRAGDFAVSHDVYLGENFDDVDAGAEGTFQGNQAAMNLIIGFPGFLYPDGLVPGTTYYWRIDEVNDTDPNSPWKGDVWSFWIPPYTAYDPDPADGVKFVPPDAELNWTAGFRAKLHYVYLGDNFDDVSSAVVGIPQGTTTYTPGTLDLDKTYYWRIDEFDGIVTHKGNVWSFSTIPIIAITDPSLVGWWTLDEGMGTTAVDWSGHGNHGRVELQKGDPQWVDGYHAGAMDMAGVTSVHIPAESWSTIENQATLALWTYGDPAGVPNTFLCGAFAGGSRVFSAHVPWGGLVYFDSGQTPGDDYDRISKAAAPSEYKGNWRHWTFVKNAETGSKEIYLDGELWYSETGMTRVMTGVTAFTLGSHPDGSNPYRGIMDDVRLYNKALTVEEIILAMRGDPLLAWGPNPSQGSTLYIRDATPLSWSPGDNASQHDVYFGTDRDAVADADASDTTGIYRGRQGVTIYTPPDVEWGGGPYYWRIDEYNTDATISKGNVWSFTVTDFIGIDDIEDYNDYPPDEIFSTWIDGWEVPTNGSLAGHTDPPFAETGNVHGGSQSMPVYYENNFKYSEVTMTLVSVRDWTEEGVGVLSLWFYGDTSNAAERMYIALNGSATVYHDNPDAALIEEWTQWTIDLQEFTGVNLANVNTISIGFGDKNNLQAGGSGMVLFDDIRLYQPAPVPEPAP